MHFYSESSGGSKCDLHEVFPSWKCRVGIFILKHQEYINRKKETKKKTNCRSPFLWHGGTGGTQGRKVDAVGHRLGAKVRAG